MWQLSCSLYEHLTIRLLALRRFALADLALLLQINIPTLRCTGGIFQRKSEDCIAILDGVFTV